MAFVYYNANPSSIETSDCTIRAISKVLDEPWLTSYWGVCIHGAIDCKMPSTNSVWGEYLEQRGFKRRSIKLNCEECTSVINFCRYHPTGRFAVATGSHVVAVVNGDYYDIWDFGHEVPLYYFIKES